MSTGSGHPDEGDVATVRRRIQQGPWEQSFPPSMRMPWEAASSFDEVVGDFHCWVAASVYMAVRDIAALSAPPSGSNTCGLTFWTTLHDFLARLGDGDVLLPAADLLREVVDTVRAEVDAFLTVNGPPDGPRDWVSVYIDPYEPEPSPASVHPAGDQDWEAGPPALFDMEHPYPPLPGKRGPASDTSAEAPDSRETSDSEHDPAKPPIPSDPELAMDGDRWPASFGRHGNGLLLLPIRISAFAPEDVSRIYRKVLRPLIWEIELDARVGKTATYPPTSWSPLDTEARVDWLLDDPTMLVRVMVFRVHSLVAGSLAQGLLDLWGDLRPPVNVGYPMATWDSVDADLEAVLSRLEQGGFDALAEECRDIASHDDADDDKAADINRYLDWRFGFYSYERLKAEGLVQEPQIPGIVPMDPETWTTDVPVRQIYWAKLKEAVVRGIRYCEAFDIAVRTEEENWYSRDEFDRGGP